ncbi:hypothetical protein C8R43DRAFT_1036986 [Mycena crocata]|nr:hypothetical protein C8R43DRAFT_1036986 [Mycena crocata]
MGGNRGGGLSGRGGRGGGSYSAGGAPGARGGGGGSGGPVRGHGSRGNFGGNKDFHNRRGGGSFAGGGGGGSFQNPSGSFRARGQNHSNSGRGRNDGAGGNATFGAANSSFNSGKKDENRRTLTDFKIVGLEIRELAWSWGVLPSLPIKLEPKEVSLAADDSSQDIVKAETAEEDNVKGNSADGSDAVASTSSVTDVKPAVPAPDIPLGPRAVPDTGPPPSRMRIYFHTPVSAVDSHPIPHNGSFSLGATPSDSRKGKRKKIESDDGDFEEGRGPPPPPGMHDDRSSVAASAAPSATETASEADWLMAAIAGEAESDSHGPDGNDDDENHGHDAGTEAGAETDTDGNVGGVGVDMAAEALAHDNHTSTQRTAEPDVPTVPEAFSASFSSDAVDDGAVPHVNGHEGVPPEVVAKSVSGPASAAADASLSSVHTAVSSVSISGSAESEQVATDRPNTPVSETQSNQGEQSLLSLSATATLLSIHHPPATSSLGGDATIVLPENGHESEQTQELEATQVDEPPPSLTVSATSTTYGDAYQPVKPEVKGPKVPAANRLSISYEGGNRRIVVDAEVVDTITLFRREARAEVHMNVISDGEKGLKGILMETLSEVTKSYNPIQPTADSNDFPPFSQASTPSAITLMVHLDVARPLSEPKWVKTGDIPEWLKSIFGRMFWFAGDASESWEKKIVVSDPDPPPTLGTVLEGWTVASSAGTLTERQRFLKTHLSEIDNILEILLRLVRGDRTSPSTQNPAPSLSGPLLAALSPSSAHAAQQTPVSLAVLAMFRMTIEYANKASGDKGKADVEERLGEIIRCLPPSQIHKSLDAIFKEWKVEKKSR